MLNIAVESIRVYAKLNYLRDRAFGLTSEKWNNVAHIYLEEADVDRDRMLTEDEIDAIISKIK